MPFNLRSHNNRMYPAESLEESKNWRPHNLLNEYRSMIGNSYGHPDDVEEEDYFDINDFDDFMPDMHFQANPNEFIQSNRATNLRWQAYVNRREQEN